MVYGYDGPENFDITADGIYFTMEDASGTTWMATIEHQLIDGFQNGVILQ